MADHNDWSFYRAALTGKRIETEPGDPRTGFYRSQTGREVVGIWRDDDGKLCCQRIGGKHGDGSKMSPEQIDELFGWVCLYPIPYELFQTVENGGTLPPIYTTRLTTAEIQGGVAWTEELGKAKLAHDPEKYDENGELRPGPGHNNPPEDLPPDRALAKRIHDLGVTLGKWLTGIGGKPRNAAEAEILGGYANKFKDFENEAVAAHKAEKDPHWQKCKEIDAKWFVPVRDKAVASRQRVIDIGNEWVKAEDARKAKEAREAQDLAEATTAPAPSASIDNDTPPAPPPAAFAPEPTKISSMRGTGKRQKEILVVDLAAFLAHCASMTPPQPIIVEAAEKAARAFKAAGLTVPGMAADQKEVA